MVYLRTYLYSFSRRLAKVCFDHYSSSLWPDLKDHGALLLFYSVQYARVFAATLVVIAHLSGFILSSPPEIGNLGGFGVDIFFVISGFIMWNTSHNKTSMDFLVRRFIRLCPVYWVYTILLVIIAVIPGRLAPNIEVSTQSLLKSFLFIPFFNSTKGIQPLLSQGWTLNFEFYFYLIFGLSLFVHQSLRFMFLSSFFAACALSRLIFDFDNALFITYTDPTVFEFLFGVVVAKFFSGRTVTTKMASVFLLFSLFFWICVALTDLSRWPRFLVYGLPATLFLAGSVGLEPFINRRPIKSLVLLGDSSYSLYLCHPFVLKGVMVVFLALHIDIGSGPASIVLFCVTATITALIVSVYSFRFIERPLANFLKQVFFGGRENTRKVLFGPRND